MKFNRLTGSEKLAALNTSIQEFWKWAFSDLFADNVMPILAEFIVGKVLELTSLPRIDWNHTSFIYKGCTLDIRSISYVHSEPKQDSKNAHQPSFDSKAKEGWDILTGKHVSGFLKKTDLYVICVYKGLEKITEEILNLDNWEFYVIPGFTLNRKSSETTIVNLDSIKIIFKNLNVNELKKEIDKIILDINVKVFLFIDWLMQDVKTYLYNGSDKYYLSVKKESQSSSSDGNESIESSISGRTLGDLKPDSYIILDQTDTYELDFHISINFYMSTNNIDYEEYYTSIPKYIWMKKEKIFNPVLDCEVLELDLKRFK